MASLKFLKERFPEELEERLSFSNDVCLATFCRRLEFLSVALWGNEGSNGEPNVGGSLTPGAIMTVLYEPLDSEWRLTTDSRKIKAAKKKVCERLGVDPSQTWMGTSHDLVMGDSEISDEELLGSSLLS